MLLFEGLNTEPASEGVHATCYSEGARNCVGCGTSILGTAICVPGFTRRVHLCGSMARGFASRGSGFRGNFRGRANSFRGRGNRGRGGATSRGPAAVKEDDGSKAEARFEQTRIEDEIDEKLGFPRYQEGPPREGWMVNMHPVCNSRIKWLMPEALTHSMYPTDPH